MSMKHGNALPDDMVLRVRQLGKEYKLYPSPRSRLRRC